MNFYTPGWLVLLLFLPVFLVVVIALSRRQHRWNIFVAARLRSSLIRREPAWHHWLSFSLLLAALCCFIFALARPQGNAGTRVEKSTGRNVMVALDLSRSMRVTDVSPDRMGAAKVVIYELFDALPKERIGLIGFAGTPYLYAPLTNDHAAIRETVQQMDENWASTGGSNLYKAVELAISTLKKTGQKNNALVIISDGEENADEIHRIIKDAKLAGLYIFAIGVGTENGGYVPNAESPPGSRQRVTSHLQPDILRKLAEETKGKFAIAGQGANIPALVKEGLQQLDVFQMDERHRLVVVEYYQWFAFPGVALLLISIILRTRWKGIAGKQPLRNYLPKVSLALVACLLCQTAFSRPVGEAAESLKQRKWKEAQSSYHKLADESKSPGRAEAFRFGEGTAAYGAQDFRAARSAFSAALLSPDTTLTSQAHFSLGNTLFQLGWQGLTSEAYPAKAESIPDLNRFDLLVKERLARLKQSKPGKKTDNEEFLRINAMVSNWSDAIRHYRSAAGQGIPNEGTSKNETLTLTYLTRLQELLKEDQQKTQGAMPQVVPVPGPGSPDEERESGKPGQKGNSPDQGGGDESEDEEEGEAGGDNEEDDDKKGAPKPDESDHDKDRDNKEPSPTDGPGDPNETQEDRARRLLKENSDAENGPLNARRGRDRNLQKDW